MCYDAKRCDLDTIFTRFERLRIAQTPILMGQTKAKIEETPFFMCPNESGSPNVAKCVTQSWGPQEGVRKRVSKLDALVRLSGPPGRL